MSVQFVQRTEEKPSLNLSVVESAWNWPCQQALEAAAESRPNSEIDGINRDLELFAKTRIQSCRIIKLLRDAEDASFELDDEVEALEVA